MTTVYTFLGGYSNAYVGVEGRIPLCAYMFAVPFLWSHVGGLQASVSPHPD
jgi:hypothetical protein